MTALPRALRIALISEHASPLAALGGVDAGGQNTYVAHVADALARMGHQVDVLTRRDERSQPTAVDVRPRYRVLHIDAGPASFVPKEQLLQHMPAFGKAAGTLFSNSVPYDVIHANFFMSGWVGMQLKHRFRVPLVTTFHALGRVRLQHQSTADGFPSERLEIEQALMRESDRIVAECPQDRLDMLSLYGADRGRLAIVPCGVDLSELAPVPRAVARRRLGLDADEFIVLQLGRIVPRKGIDNVIRAVGKLQPGLRARLLVVGGEPEGAEPSPEALRLKRLAQSCGVADRTRFVGHCKRSALRDWYSAADVFVSTPWYEPFGITPLEAMACATPVIGSAVGGIKHTVLDGVTGYLVPPDDPQALHDRLGNLQARPMLARAMGLAGRQRVSDSFTWQQVAGQLASIYQQVARHSQPQPRSLRAVPQSLVPVDSVPASSVRALRGVMA